MLSMLLVGFYGIVDGYFIGQYMGDDGLTAINIAWPLLGLLTSIGTGIGTGGSIIYSIHSGAGDHGKAERVVGNTLILLLLVSIILMVLFFCFSKGTLFLLGAKGQIYVYALDYIRVITYGILFQIFGAGLVPMIKNLGKPVFAMVTMFLGMVINIVLDALFLNTFQMGLAGAALATCIAQGVVAILAIGMIIKTCSLKSSLQLHKRVVSDILKIGVSPFGLTLAPSLVIVLTNYQCLRYGGNAAVAAYTIMSYGAYVIYSLMQGLADGIQPIISYCKGAGQGNMMKSTLKRAFLVGGVLTIILIFVTVANRQTFPIFYGASLEVAVDASVAMIFVAVSVPFITIARVMSAYFYAVRDNKNAAIMVYCDPLVFTPLFLLIFPLFWGVLGIWAVYPCTQIALSLLSLYLVKKKS